MTPGFQICFDANIEATEPLCELCVSVADIGHRANLPMSSA